MKDTKIEDRKPEIWKDIKEYEGLYKISSWGNVKSFHKSKKGKILSTCLRNTYVSLQLSKNRKKKAKDYCLYNKVIKEQIEIAFLSLIMD